MGSTLTVDNIVGATTAANVKLPAGCIVQTSFHTFSTETVLNSNSDADLGGSSHTFTPKFASSLLILSCSVHIQLQRDAPGSNNGGTVNFVVDGVNINHPTNNADYEHYINQGGSGGTSFYTRTQKEVSISASNTNAKTIKLVGRPHDTANSGLLRINTQGYHSSSIKIQEIAQ